MHEFVKHIGSISNHMSYHIFSDSADETNGIFDCISYSFFFNKILVRENPNVIMLSNAKGGNSVYTIRFVKKIEVDDSPTFLGERYIVYSEHGFTHETVKTVIEAFI